jgi:hypothetical protein
MAADRELISKTTRTAVRQLLSVLAQGAIVEYWENQEFTAIPGSEPSRDGGVRKKKFDSYADAVDWRDEDQVIRALRVFESILCRLRRETWLSDEEESELRTLLATDGCRLDADLRIHTPRTAHLRVHLEALGEASGIAAELDRVRRFGTEYPDDAIGAAKQLIEATAKLVLRERGLPVDDSMTLPPLIKQAQQALLLHPAAPPEGSAGVAADNADSIKRILGALSSAAIGVAELRNRYGTGHGRLAVPTGLGPRHARFAVGTAATWCELLLDTLQDPAAPWRKATPTPASTGP